MIGTRLGNYEITAKIGDGGMGVVYRGKDLQLHRDVAIKVLPPEFAEDRDRVARFEREARLLASLNHPNIAQVYGFICVGQLQALIMEVIEGPTLAEHILLGPLPFQECLSLSIQIVQALAEAHDHGIVHRDLKPQNIKLTRGGRIKVLDFGLARRDAVPGSQLTEAATSTGATQSGVILGTIGYVAPERVRGAAADTRADIFSLGCVLYEMSTGVRAFARDTPFDTLSAILNDRAPVASQQRPDLPSGFDRVVAHCLEKDPANRFQSAHDLEFALAALNAGDSFARRNPRPASVAVLPFINLSADPDNEFFADGMTEDVIAHLAKIRSLKVISRTSVMAFKKRDRSLREISEKLRVVALLDGSVRRAGNRVRIVAELIDGGTDEHIWSETYDREVTDIFSIQTDVALSIANMLRAELSKAERERVGRPLSEDVLAYELYLRGRNAFCRFSEEGFRSSIPQFEAAIARDPGFAMAWASLAEVHTEFCIQGYAGNAHQETIRRAKQAAARALELDDELAEAHGISGLIRFVFDYDWAGAEREFLRALDLSPSSAQVHDHYSWLCASQERYEDAVRQVRLAQELDPGLIQSDVATSLLRATRVDEAVQEARRALQADPGAPRCHAVLGWALIFHGESATGIAEMEHAVALAPTSSLFLSQLGQAYALTGSLERARQILDQLRDRSTREFVSPYHLAYVHAGLGEADAAIDWLERAFEWRSGAIYGIKGSFLFRNLHGHPRFTALLRRMNLA
ncbi:MAG TPA: protein kinase [Terriglobales bacterium]|nr:protein kinase [Terriglobales bacterium]